MATSPNDEDENPTPPERSTVVLLLNTIGDTTWRMFVPTVGLLLVGLWADDQIGTKPWLTVSGILLGTLLAGLLIRNQLRNVHKQ